jgi:hypothetical protein
VACHADALDENFCNDFTPDRNYRYRETLNRGSDRFIASIQMNPAILLLMHQLGVPCADEKKAGYRPA